MAPSLSEFDFGLPDGYPVPLVEPHPDDEIAYTIFHVARALESIEAIGPGATIDPIFQSFPVCCLNYPSCPPTFHQPSQLTSSRLSRLSVQFSLCNVTGMAC